MKSEWKILVIDVILYGLIILYECTIENFRFEFDLRWSKRKRRLFCNAVGAVMVIVDVVGMSLTGHAAQGGLERIVIFYALAALLGLHILNSVFALLKWKKVYVAVDIIEFLIRFAAALTCGAVQLFSSNVVKGLLIMTILYFLFRRATRMLNGGWLDSRLEAFDTQDDA